ncbi:MAG: formate dehydrogenase [Thermodesulfobacteriota bacterium]
MSAAEPQPSSSLPQVLAFAGDAASYPAKAARFLAQLLEKGVVTGVAVPVWTSDRCASYQLLTAPALLAQADPFAPVMLRNAAEQLAELSRQGLSQPVALVLRSCEMRALVELAKLKQANLANCLLVGADCLGTMPVTTLTEGGQGLSQRLMTEPLAEGAMRSACRLCAERTPPVADLVLLAIGVAAGGPLLVEARTGAGAQAVSGLGLAETPAPAGRPPALAALAQAATDRLAQASATDLLEHLGRCSRCYNCRNLCPICYCPECVFVPAKLGYDSERYLAWATRKGSLSLPTDVVLFHLTRMSHMLTSCVGCGICEAVCPNQIPLGRIYSVLRKKVQDQFGYQAGRALDEPLPVTVFAERELASVEE